MAPFKSDHNKDVDYVSLCEIFVFPSEISCLPSSMLHHIVDKHFCILLIHPNMVWANNPKEYLLPENVTRMTSIEYESVDCVAGVMGPAITYDRFPDIQFNRLYTALFPHIKNVMGLNNTYAVAHWRRGDQLTSRCKKGLDESLNCASVNNFLIEMVAYEENYANNISHRSIVIATDDDQEKDLVELRKAGYKLVADYHSQIAKMLSSPRGKLSSVDTFAIDLMLMCDADWLFAWGESKSNGFIPRCRKNPKTTLINKPSSKPDGP